MAGVGGVCDCARAGGCSLCRLSDRLVTFMLDTYTRAAMAAQRRQDADYYYNSYPPYYGYGYP